jgi:uncharacterized protein YoxC
MSGETEQDVSGWTTDTLHSLLTVLLTERAKEFDARFDAQERALSLAREADLRNQGSLIKVIETRFDAMDKATNLLSDTVNRFPTDVELRVAQLKAVHDERFKGIESKVEDLASGMVVRFQERDTRSERESRDAKIAVEAAFAAAKEAVAENNKSSALATDKSEIAFTKQIDAIQLLITATNKAIDDKVADLKARADNGSGRSGATADFRALSLSTITIVVAIVGIIAYFIGTHIH